MASTASCGPSRAAFAAHWVAALTQEWVLTARRVASGANASGQTPQPMRQPVMA